MVRMWKCCDGSVVAQVRIWTFRVSGSAKYVMQRGVGLPGSDATCVMRFPTTFPWVFQDWRPLSRAVLVLQLGALDLGMFPRGIKGMGVSVFAGAGVGSGSAGAEVGKKGRSK